MNVSVVIPAKNEESTIAAVVTGALRIGDVCEVVVVDDGSTDATAAHAGSAGARVVSHPYSRGNGAAVRSGALAATQPVLVFMDGDGQHDPADIPKLLEQLQQGHDLAVGARRTRQDQASFARWGANSVYNRLASLLVGHRVDDLTSGFRAFRRREFLSVLPLLPNGFSYPTTSTMAYFRAGRSVRFVPVRVGRRAAGAPSHIRPLRDGLRFLTIIFKVVTLYSPLKVFAPVSAALFAIGSAYYLYTYMADERFTNMGMLLFLSSLMTFLFGLLAEQITTLIHLQVRPTDAAPTAERRTTDEP